ncbi:MAG: hypothetical protein LCI00_30520 [Chloroflexi bacterium]|nr:hypothetical protein [Chloroflexota bacterium]MCC6894728.1 hypothetical protein [Anaerolineae bacterium]
MVDVTPISKALSKNCEKYECMSNLRISLAIVLLLIACILIGRNLAFDQKANSRLLDYSASIYSEEEWLNIARKAVEGFGMIGEREREEWALMTRGSYLTLLGGGGMPQDREVPLFVYKAIGNVPVFFMYGGVDGSARNIGGISLVYDGTTGLLSSFVAYPNDNVARGETGPNLSFIPRDTGFNPDLFYPIPTLGR